MIIKDKKRGVRTSSALALGLFALLLPACQQENEAYNAVPEEPIVTETREPVALEREPLATDLEEPIMTPRTTALGVEQQSVTTEDISANPERYLGQMVTVRGGVKEIDTSSDTFLMDEDRFLTNEGILIINSSGEVFAIPNADEMEVQATGEVRQFNLVDINTAYGLDLDPLLYAEYENQPAIVAQSLALAPTPEQVSENPDLFYNRPIAIEGRFNEKLASNAFTFNNENEEILVLNADELEILPENEYLVVTGEVRPFDLAALQSEYNLNWDAALQQQMQDLYSSSLVLVADGIYPTY